MSWFQLDPQSIASRTTAERPIPAIPSLGGSIVRGALGFTVVSIAGFIPWAIFGRTLYRAIGEVGMYLVCAAVFLVLSSLLLHRLIIGPGSRARFAKVFTIAFSVYSILWIVGWMAFKGHTGSIVGLLAGCAAMGLILAIAFDALPRAVPIIAALFVLNTIGYFVGGWVEAAVFKTHRVTAMLLWGVFYGLGLGAGLGVAFYLCQKKARDLIASGITPDTSPTRVES